jgi:hypothetical protein
VDRDPAGGQRVDAARVELRGGRAQQVARARQGRLPQRLPDRARRAHERGAPRALRGREQRVGLLGLEARVEQVRDGAHDRAEAVLELAEPAQGSLPAGCALDKEREEQLAGRPRVAQHVERHGVQRLDADAEQRPAGQVVAQAARRDDDAQRCREPLRIVRRLCELLAQRVEQRALDGERAATDANLGLPPHESDDCTPLRQNRSSTSVDGEKQIDSGPCES